MISVNILLSVRKHLAEMCGYIIFADLRTFLQMCVFNGKPCYLQTFKYDVSISSPVVMTA